MHNNILHTMGINVVAQTSILRKPKRLMLFTFITIAVSFSLLLYFFAIDVEDAEAALCNFGAGETMAVSPSVLIIDDLTVTFGMFANGNGYGGETCNLNLFYGDTDFKNAVWGCNAGFWETPVHTYAVPGTYTIRLRMNDPHGHVCEVARDVTVTAPPIDPGPPPPPAEPVISASLIGNPIWRATPTLTTNFSATISKTNCDGCNVRWQFNCGNGVTPLWDFVDSPGTKNFPCPYSADGTYSARLDGSFAVGIWPDDPCSSRCEDTAKVQVRVGGNRLPGNGKNVCERQEGRAVYQNPGWWWRNANFSPGNKNWHVGLWGPVGHPGNDVGGILYKIRFPAGGTNQRTSWNPCRFSGDPSRENWGPLPFAGGCDEGVFSGQKAYFTDNTNPNNSQVFYKFPESLTPLGNYTLEAHVQEDPAGGHNNHFKGGGFTPTAGRTQQFVAGPTCSGAPVVGIGTPLDGEAVSDTVIIRGFALDYESRLENVRVLIDGYTIKNGEPATEVGYGQNRPDACRFYYWDTEYPDYYDKDTYWPLGNDDNKGCKPNPADPDLPDPDPPYASTAHPTESFVGFEFLLDTTRLLAGIHTLRIEFTDNDGAAGCSPGFCYQDQIGYQEITFDVDNPYIEEMILFQDPLDDTPDDWTCISCGPGDDFYQKFVMGTPLYGAIGGSATHTHSVTISDTMTEFGPRDNVVNGVDVPNDLYTGWGHKHSGADGTSDPISNLPFYRNLKVIKSDSPTSTLPFGAIVMLDSVVMPSADYTRYAVQDGFFIRGKNIVGNGGSNTHSDSFTINTAFGGSGLWGDVGGTICQTTRGHDHTAIDTTALKSNEPKHARTVLARVTNPAGTLIADGVIALFPGAPDPAEWEVLSDVGGALQDDFIKGNSTADFSDFGSNMHNPDDITGFLTGRANQPVDMRLQCGNPFAASDSTHRHDVDVTIDSADHIPEFFGAIAAKFIGFVLIPPSASGVTTIEPDYCSGPAITVSWTYNSGTGGALQSAYQVQIDNSSFFDSPEIDTGKIVSGGNSFFSGPGLLQFDETYYVRVMVWDTDDVSSAWSSSVFWNTPIHAYPQADFSWTPLTGIKIGEDVQFTDESVVVTGPSAWLWDFGDGETSLAPDPIHQYDSEGIKTITLTVTDAEGFICTSNGQNLEIEQELPRWIEVLPR